jgi:hypothetical protein
VRMPRVTGKSNRRQTGPMPFRAALYIKAGTHLYGMSMWQWESTSLTTAFSGCLSPTLISSAICATQSGISWIGRDTSGTAVVSNRCRPE